jgi:hypothetical protein
MTVFAIVCMCIFAGFFVLYHTRRDTRPIGFSEILVFLNPVHINGLLKLVDTLEEAYERETHTRIEFAQIQAMRIAAGREHFRKIVANAVALQNFGYRHLSGEDDTKRWLAHRLINYAVPVKMFGRAGIFTLFLCKRFLFLDHVLVRVRLPILQHLVGETIEAYDDLKEAALMLARHSEAGIEVKLAARL